MSLRNLQKELNHLTYSEMVTLADEIAKQLVARTDESACANTIADVLSKLKIVPPSMSDDEKAEERLLRSAFSRKRQVTIQTNSSGWSLECSTLPGSQVIGNALRPMFPMMIDQIITMQALQGKR